MKLHRIHSWKLTPKEAIRLQERLKKKIVLKNAFESLKDLKFIAGCDLALDLKKNHAIGGVIVFSFPELKEVERKIVVRKLTFPYVPGLLSFREGPVLLDAIESLKIEPDLFVFDGQGIAHPRRLGLASHMGLFLKKPTIGCAKSRLYGQYREPHWKKGSFSPLVGDDGKPMGVVLRTRDHVRPVFVSPGHKIRIGTASRVILKCCDGFRIPKPTRFADHAVEAYKRKIVS